MTLGEHPPASFFRQDQLSGEWVLFASDRSQRPNAFAREALPPTEEVCPFCPGMEHETPPEITRRGTPERWTIRVVPNRYPALSQNVDDPQLMTGDHPASGPHEVIIDSRTHTHLDLMSPSDAAELFEVYTERVTFVRQRNGVQSVMLFKNDGPNAGESIHHPHTQLLGLPMIPERIARMARTFGKGCPLCADVRSMADAAFRSRLIHETEDFLILAPYAPRRAYEVWVVPRNHVGSIELMPPDLIHAFARAAQRAVKSVRNIAPHTSFNVCFYQAPGKAAPFHLYAEIAPRRSTMGGFEVGTGVMINVVPPEAAAAKLRTLSGE